MGWTFCFHRAGEVAYSGSQTAVGTVNCSWSGGTTARRIHSALPPLVSMNRRVLRCRMIQQDTSLKSQYLSTRLACYACRTVSRSTVWGGALTAGSLALLSCRKYPIVLPYFFKIYFVVCVCVCVCRKATASCEEACTTVVQDTVLSCSPPYPGNRSCLTHGWTRVGRCGTAFRFFFLGVLTNTRSEPPSGKAANDGSLSRTLKGFSKLDTATSYDATTLLIAVMAIYACENREAFASRIVHGLA